MIFVAVLVVMLLLRWLVVWLLSWRQCQAAAQQQPSLPAEFAEISLSDRQKATAYLNARQQVARWSIGLSTVLCLSWTIGGGLAWLDGQTEQWAPWVSQWGHGLLVVAVFALINSLVCLPISLYATFVVEKRFDFNRTSLSLYAIDWIKSMVLNLVFGGVLVGVLLWLMILMRDTGWWLWAWCFIVSWNMSLLLIYPVWLAPLFNRFSPLKDQQLNERIERLLARCGCSVDQVYVMDGSKHSAHSNAYFTGLGRKKRVVLFDTLLEQLNVDQIEAVLAHELGHSALGHIPKRLIWTALWCLPALWLIDVLWHTDWFFAAFSLSNSEHTVLLLFVLIAPVFSFFIQPLFNHFSRQHEFAADAYAKLHSNAQALIEALIKMYQGNAVSLNSDRWYSLWYDSHPAPRQRIAQLKVGD